MHPSAHKIIEDFSKTLTGKEKILDAGSMNVNGSFKDIFTGYDYTGVDLEAGPNVDVVARSPYEWGFDYESFDVVISGNCMEHVADPFKWVLEVDNVLKSGGMICIQTPHTIHYHPYPKDYWRIRKDGMRHLFTDWFIENGRKPFEIIKCEEEGIDTFIIARKPL